MRQVASRSQRRMEKKQALILLVLMLAVSLASFTLGVMVGRGGGSKAPAETKVVDAPVRMPVAKEDSPGDTPTAPPESKEDEVAKALTFYDALPRGEQPPLGSGINLPPSEKPEKEAPPRVSTQSPTEETKKATAVSSPSKSPVLSSGLPAHAATGTHVVQVASFRSMDEASRLRTRLVAAGYQAFVEKADLGNKGVWHRVLVGPYAGEADAERVVTRLKQEQKLTAMVRKR